MAVVVVESIPWVGLSGTLTEVIAELKRREVDPDQDVQFFYNGTNVSAVYYRGLGYI